MDNLFAISTLVIDVDGTLTDGGIYYSNQGLEIKKFCTKDAAAFFACNALGVKTIVLTGRECSATERRLVELKVSIIQQGVHDKRKWLGEYMKNNNISKNEVGYIGDDLNDYDSMKLCGFIGCPSTACAEIKEIADYVSMSSGGNGAVREIVEYILSQRGEWKKAISKAYGFGV